MNKVARLTIKTVIVLALAHSLIRALFWSQYDMDVWNMFSRLMNHGKDWEAVGNVSMTFIVCAGLLVSTALVWGVTRLWRRVRRLPAQRPWALRRSGR
jgi:hypothetical protein